MPRLQKSGIQELTNKLERWQTPREMLALFSKTGQEIGSETLFNQAGLAFLRDAWIGAKLGVAVNAKLIRLIGEDRPDLELQIDGRHEKFEATEADDPGRKRGIEYRSQHEEITEDPVEEWVKRAEAAPSWIRAACSRKEKIAYSPDTNLVVYLNMSEYGIRQPQVEASFTQSTASVKSQFRTVWVLWQQKAYLVWKNGSQANR